MPFLAPALAPELLASVDELTAFRQGEEAASVEQATLALAAATGAVRRYCGWRLDAASESFVVDGVQGAELLLPTLYLTAVTAVTVDGVALVDGTDFEWSRSGILSSSTTTMWAAPRRGVTVEAQHGYDPVPDDVKGVVLAAAARAVTAPNGELRESVGEWSAALAAAGVQLTDGERLLLNPYRLFD